MGDQSKVYYVSVWWLATLMLGVLCVWLKLLGYNFGDGWYTTNWASVFSVLTMVGFGVSAITHTVACGVEGSMGAGLYYDEEAIKDNIDTTINARTETQQLRDEIDTLRAQKNAEIATLTGHVTHYRNQRDIFRNEADALRNL